MKETLYLFTNKYPYGTEESFIENELSDHLNRFKNVKLIPLVIKGPPREIDKNISVINIYENVNYTTLKLLKLYFFSFFQLVIKEFYHSELKLAFIRKLPLLKSILWQNFKRAELLKNYLSNEQDIKASVFYSFWTDDWATVLSILKKQNVIPDFVSRVHGYDLYAERWHLSIIPFRNLQIESVSKIFTASKDGLLYLQSHFPKNKNKFYLSHLNVSDNGIGPFDNSGIFTIVSCSHLIPLKRVHLIAEMLCKIKFNAKWVHFGTGTEKDKILSITKKIPANIIVELKGNVANAEIINYYKTHTVNVFIHVSETEGGVPIALQEAASFGIPLIGTTAGGIVEIVNEKTGILVPIDVKPDELVKTVTEFKDSPLNTTDFRAGVRKFWQDQFNSKTNYNKFADLLSE